MLLPTVFRCNPFYVNRRRPLRISLFSYSISLAILASGGDNPEQCFKKLKMLNLNLFRNPYIFSCHFSTVLPGRFWYTDIYKYYYCHSLNVSVDLSDTNIMSVYSYINEPLFLPWDYTLRSLEPFACTEPDENQQDQDFMTIYQQAILYVPKGTAEAYRKSPVFKNFSNVQEMELSTRTIAVTKNRQTPFPIYDLTGRRIKKQYSNRVYIEDGFKITKWM